MESKFYLKSIRLKIAPQLTIIIQPVSHSIRENRSAGYIQPVLNFVDSNLMSTYLLTDFNVSFHYFLK